MLNEGLEMLCDKLDNSGNIHHGAFQNSGIEEITLPSTLREINKRTFQLCNNL